MGLEGLRLAMPRTSLFLVLLHQTASLRLSWLGINALELHYSAGTRVLVDPILAGPLVFFDRPGAYRATPRDGGAAAAARRRVLASPPYDALLITQGWEDHAHPETLELVAASRLLKPDALVVAPPSAAEAVESALGAATTLRHGESAARGPLRVEAFPGALTGPPWATRQNGLLISHDGEPGLFVEPHGDLGGCSDAFLRGAAPRVDALVMPDRSQTLLGYDLVRSSTTARAARLLEPSAVVPLRNGDVDATGAIAPLIVTGPAESYPPGLAEVSAPLGAWADLPA